MRVCVYIYMAITDNYKNPKDAAGYLNGCHIARVIVRISGIRMTSWQYRAMTAGYIGGLLYRCNFTRSIWIVLG